MAKDTGRGSALRLNYDHLDGAEELKVPVEKGQHNRAKSHILKILFFHPVAAAASSSEAELAPKREAAPGEATALEALLRGDSLLEKKNSLCKEEETLLEIQVLY